MLERSRFGGGRHRRGDDFVQRRREAVAQVQLSAHGAQPVGPLRGRRRRPAAPRHRRRQPALRPVGRRRTVGPAAAARPRKQLASLLCSLFALATCRHDTR